MGQRENSSSVLYRHPTSAVSGSTDPGDFPDLSDVMRGGFAPVNTIASADTPTFTKRTNTPEQKRDFRDFRDFVNSSRTTTPPFELPNLQWTSASSQSTNGRHNHSISNIGDSSSIFDSPPIVSRLAKSAINKNLNTSTSLSRNNHNKMVNERSPAKPPLHPVAPNEKPSAQAESSFPSKPPQPQFSQPTFPQSPLSKHKESSIFIQPKNRPEHHRDQPKHAHPHLHALKDAAQKVVQPLVDNFKNEPKYAPPHGNAVPVIAPSGQVFTTIKPASQPTFGSMGGTFGGYGGFQSVNNAPNFVDLTNPYRDRLAPQEPYTFVDPAKAQEDLKALLEGMFEDEDEKPRTRSRKKSDAESERLSAKMNDLQVRSSEEKIQVESDEEEEDDGTVEGIIVKLLPHQVGGVGWMRGRELGTGKRGTVPKGGILADDMGLGKTLQSISLILNNPRPSVSDDDYAKRKLPSGLEKATLVVAPLALIRQWEQEIKDKVESSHSLRVCVHHGPQRTKRFADLKRYDVVITTYQILVSEFGSSSGEPDGVKVGCFGLHWYRVILDEAHTIKNRNAKATQACYALRSQYRWCLTGTPMQNNLDELQSLIKFLRIKPYDDLREFKDQIDRPMKNGRGDVAIKRLRHYLKIFMKRRTKDILKQEGALNPGGKPSVAGEVSTTGFRVTERKIEKVFAEFSAEERRFYERLEQRTDASIEKMMSGEKVNYASALVLLLRLRQACNHPKLVAGKLAKDKEALAGEAANSSPRKKVSSGDIDEVADMLGAMEVGSKKCEVCQLELGKEAVSQGAIRCLDCEEDLDIVSKKHKSRKDKKHRHKHEKKSKAPVRAPRNRAIITDSDDEDEGGEWVVPKHKQGATNLAKAGGYEHENGEGGGEWLTSDHDETFPELEHLTASQKEAVDSSESGSETDSADEVEDEFQSSGEEAELATMVSSTKIRHLLKILGKEVSQHKFIVFSQFTSMLDLIEPFLRQQGFKYTRYDGSMRNDMREASLSKLRNDKNCRILLCSLKCGSLGLNLTAATRVVILEPFWNPFVEEQAIDRVHRLTQKIDVLVYKITIQDSVEERILALQEKKRELANQTIEGSKGGAGKLGMKEILQLFRRDAEHAPPAPGAATYDLATKPRVLKESSIAGSSASSSREGSATYVPRDRKVTPPTQPPGQIKMPKTTMEDSVYGRRW